MVRGPGMKIDVRWMVQAVAFIGCIFFFIKIWEKSKLFFERITLSDVLGLATYAILFLICFFIMAVTSYLKQRHNGTLKNQIPFFEKLISKFGLA
jgi:NAD/NADP transhydrogenase beta subunit